MGTRDVSNRIAALEAALRPPNSLAARVRQLTQAQQATVQTWQAACRDYHAHFPGSLAYERQLDGYSGPRLPHDTEAVLFDMPSIPAGASTEQAAEIYRKAMQ